MSKGTGRHLSSVEAGGVTPPSLEVPAGVDALRLAACIEAAGRRPTHRSDEQLHRLASFGTLELANNLTRGPSPTVRAIVEAVDPLLPACGGVSVILYDRAAESFITSASTVPGQPQGLAAGRVRRRSGATRFIVDSGAALYIEDVEQDPFNANRMLAETGNRSYVGTPIRAVGETLGVLYAMGQSVGRFTPEDLEFLAIVADRAAVVVQAATEHERVSRLATQQALLSRVSATMAASEHPGVLLPEVLTSTARSLDLDALAILPAKPRPGFETCIRSVRPVGWDDLRSANELRRELVQPLLQGRAAILAMDDGAGGSAQMVALRDGRRLLPDEISTLTQLASLVATAVRRAEATQVLRASNEALAQFARVVAHDLRAPLTSIAGLVEMVLISDADALSEASRELAERAVAATHRMSDTIGALLDTAKVRVGDVRRETVELGRLVDSVLVDLADPIRVGGALFEVDPLPTAWVDAGGMRIIIQNLVENALKFTREGVPARVRISAVEVPEGLQFMIADEGMGIPEAHRGSVFMMFDRGGLADIVGQGVGLPTVARIVEAHGGEVWVEANRPQGTIAVVQIPARPIWLADDAP